MGLGTVFLWGVSFPLTKAALDYLGPTSIAFLRWTLSSAVLFIWLARRGRLPAASAVVRRDGLRALWLALAGITLFYYLENTALTYTTAINAGVLANLTTVFMVLGTPGWRAAGWTRVGGDGRRAARRRDGQPGLWPPDPEPARADRRPADGPRHLFRDLQRGGKRLLDVTVRRRHRRPGRGHGDAVRWHSARGFVDLPWQVWANLALLGVEQRRRESVVDADPAYMIAQRCCR
jgi:hypothetical protein